MASISKDAGGRKRLLYVDGSGERKTIYLGKITLADAREIKNRVEHILSAKTARRSFDNTTAAWLEKIPEVLATKLSKHELIPPRERLNEITLESHLANYFKRRSDVKPSTKKSLLLSIEIPTFESKLLNNTFNSHIFLIRQVRFNKFSQHLTTILLFRRINI